MDFLAYIPFVEPVMLVGWERMMMLFPLCLAISIVYKTTKCDDIREVPVASLVLWVTILVGLYSVGVGLLLAFNLLA